MKQIILASIASICLLQTSAQGKPVVAKKPAAPVLKMKTLLDSASYAIGCGEATFNKNQKNKPLNVLFVTKALKEMQSANSRYNNEQIMNEVLQRLQNHKRSDSLSFGAGLRLAYFFRQQGIQNLKAEFVAKGITDVQTGRKPLLNGDQINNTVMALLNKISAEKAKGAIEEGEKFLAENKKRPGVTVTASGLQFEVIKPGSGPQPAKEDSVVCHYTGRFVTGNTFESSLDHGNPVTFSVKDVIAGWTEGLQLMKAGSTYVFYIPHHLAYGVYENGPIPGGSTLIFEIQLLEVKKNNPNRP